MRQKPNIVYILADDLGYGDLRCFNPEGKIPTPNIDRLASGGMAFTDTHASSSVCTPSRYGILTGRYCWRSRLKSGIVWEYDGSLIEPDRLTLPGLLRENGYHTACIGKWHLGWDWPTKDGRHPNETLPFGQYGHQNRSEFAETQVLFDAPIPGGPLGRGFDSYFGVDVPNFSPYTWFQNDRLAEIPTTSKAGDLYGHNGPSIQGWRHERMLPEFAHRAAKLIETHGKLSGGSENPPFFLYMPLTSPHSPVIPNKDFQGSSGIGKYGDFVAETDWVVGQVLDALERSGQLSNTLVVFTSDNGPESQVPDDSGAYIRAQETGHFSMAGFRGVKRDVWEGGHRVPFIASWPDAVPRGTTCPQLAGLQDFFATCAELVGAQMPNDAGEDSISFLPLLTGAINEPFRESIVHHSANGVFAIRKGNRVFIDGPCGGENSEPDWFRELRGYLPHNLPGELFNLDADLMEQHNLFDEEPETVAQLSTLLAEIRGADGSREICKLPEEFLTE